MKSRIKLLGVAAYRLGRLSLIFGLGLVLLLFGLNVYVAASTQGQLYEQAAAVPHERVGVVFGAGVRPDGRLSPMLADRVNAAVRLYQDGRVDKLLMTGDNSRTDYDEVSAMRRYAITQGVAAADITLDYAGFSTYESCYRAHAIFGVKEAVLVTQRFHLPRALYTCQQLGVKAVGYSVADWGRYSTPLMSLYTVREALATLKALWEIYITRPLPTFLGPVELIS